MTSFEIIQSLPKNNEVYGYCYENLLIFQKGSSINDVGPYFGLYGTKLVRFLYKNQHTQRKLLNFEFWINGELSKIWHHFSKKVILSKQINNKKCAPKLVFFNQKKIAKDSDDFWPRKLTLKSDFGTFWQLTVNPKLKTQNSIIFFCYVDS